MANAYYATERTGGGASALDFIDGASLADNDLAFVFESEISYLYKLNATSAAAEDSPNVICPDTNAGTKRWILQSHRDATVTNKGKVELATSAETITGADLERAVTPAGLQAKVSSAAAKGIIEIATDVEAEAKAAIDKALVPANLAAIFLDEDDMTSDSNTKMCSQQSIVAYINTVNTHRSVFAYSNTNQIACAAGMYFCKDKYCSWVSTITTVATGAAGGADWWYLYLDYSAITSRTAITASELIWSTTEPVFNTTYRQWMNGDDRCIFAVRTAADNSILEFFHEGNRIILADDIRTTNQVDIDNTWTDLAALIRPVFSRQAIVTFSFWASMSSLVGYWRTNGQTGTSGHNIEAYPSASPYSTIIVQTDASGIIEFKFSGSDDSIVTIYCVGWLLPEGL